MSSQPPNGRFRNNRFALSRRRLGLLASPLGIVMLLVGVFSLVAVVRTVRRGGWSAVPSSPENNAEIPPPTPPTDPDLNNPYTSPHSGVQTPVDELFARQSTTLDQATSRYRLSNDRTPPPGYDAWFAFARSKGCLVDEYEQIHRDFEPFYQLAKSRDKKYFGKMVKKAVELAKKENVGLKTFAKITRKTPSESDEWSTNYNAEWNALLKNMNALLPLPSLNLIINHRDEPRVAFDVRVPYAQDAFLLSGDRDQTPFRNEPAPTSTFYTDEGHCLVPDGERGFLTYANNASSFLMYSASADFTTDLYPILSQSKIYPCFADILFPSEFHYPRSYWSPKYSETDHIEWEAKKPVLYWRGQSTGGWILGANYRSFARFRLIDIARTPAAANAHPPLMDVAITAFYEHFCQLEGCNSAAIKAEYDISGQGARREEVHGYKYVLDVDGNAFSGRYLGLLRSGSLVFKSTLFTEYFSSWLKPFEHYIPVRADLVDLVDRIEWARANDAEARRIQQAGKEFAERVLTDAQNDCYWGLVLLEWGRLQEMGSGWWPWS